MAKEKESSRQESSEDAAERLEREELARIHAEARREIVQRRILAADEMPTNRKKLHFLSSKAVPTGPVGVLGRFPVEIMRQIFKQLKDTYSLHSLISASRSFHECYLDDEYQCEVFCKMLVDEMTLPIFLQAVAISSDSVRRIRWTGQWTGAFQNVREFMDQYSTDSRATTYDGKSYNMRTLLSIAEFHLIIKAVTQDFFASCLNLHPWTHEKYEKNELERHEELRIQRAFYNLELYVRLFERGDDYHIQRTLLNEQSHGIILGGRNVGQEIYASFFNHFSFWEVEEMVSVKDYMEREYNDIINECKDFLAKNSQAHQYGSPSTLRKIHEAENNELGSCGYSRNHYNDFNRTFINKGVEFFWKVCNQNGPKTKIPLIDIPIQQDNILLSTQFTKIMTIHFYLIDQALNNQQSQDDTSEYSRFYYCYDRFPASRARQLDLPGSRFAYDFIMKFVRSQTYCFRDCWSSWGYCMWDMERIIDIHDIYWPTTNLLESHHGPRSRLSPRAVLLPAL
ncbi:hypothetical protein BTUL_0210g00080 [Botrytis tulipae]|uniref:F-box domain-containing protein n=1 Tax=Botrytis tulipae TaxID=87230 RepID=A0A4Z1E8H6_9HELO|nr:hypothetical protein BTUL_0210g00080 [Botrytis tulipae]